MNYCWCSSTVFAITNFIIWPKGQLQTFSSPLMVRVPIPFRQAVLDTTLCDKIYQWLATGWWFSPGTLFSSTNKTDRQDITEMLLTVTLNTITLPTQTFCLPCPSCWRIIADNYLFSPYLYFLFSEKFVMYEKLSSLSLAIPKLSFIPHAEDLASQFLQVTLVSC